MNSLFDLTGKLAVVTGARRGIGLAMATALAEAGADIIAVSANQEAQGSEVERVVTGLGRRCWPIAADLSKREAVSDFIDQARSIGPVDILISNAGTIARAPAAEYSDEMWDHVLDTNLTGPWTLAREFGTDMVARGHGKIVFTASLLSFQGGVFVPAYTASKSAIAGLTRALCNEWAAKGVTVNGIAPGYIATDNTTALRADPERSKAILDRIPTGRWGAADDLKGATVFLASSASDYVNGVILPVDGGWLAR